MRCYFLLTADEYDEPTGCVYLNTPGGPVIVLFPNEETSRFA